MSATFYRMPASLKCHIGSSTYGVEQLEKEDAIRPVMHLAERCPIYSVRG